MGKENSKALSDLCFRSILSPVQTEGLPRIGKVPGYGWVAVHGDEELKDAAKRFARELNRRDRGRDPTPV